MRTAVGIDLKEPTWFRLPSVRVDLKRLFIKLGEATAHGALAITGHGASISKSVVSAIGTLEAFSIHTPLESRAWQLIHRATARALGQLTEELVEAGRAFAGDLERLTAAADVKIDQQSLRVTTDFFVRPHTIRILPVITNHFGSWLQAYGLSQAEALTISSRLPSYFILGLHDEWRDSKEFYLPLIERITSPFSALVQIEEDWERYRIFLQNQIDAPVFGDTFSLRQIYVPLRGSFTLPTQRDRGGVEIQGDFHLDKAGSICDHRLTTGELLRWPAFSTIQFLKTTT
jgi:hypothetical protein